jgi:putative oxidoreductase
MRDPALTNSGLLLLRVLLGILLAAHGGLKFLQPGGLDFEADLLAKDGLRGGRPAAAVSGITQVGTGALLAMGLLTPLAGAGAIGALVVAVFAKAHNGFWVAQDGAEFPLMFVALGIVVTLIGPGQWSLDHVLHIEPTTAETLGAIALGLLSGAATFPALRQRQAKSKDARLAAAAVTTGSASENSERAVHD